MAHEDRNVRPADGWQGGWPALLGFLGGVAFFGWTVTMIFDGAVSFVWDAGEAVIDAVTD